MTIAYIDLIGGASGDMLLGALFDAGLSLDALNQKFRKLPISGWTLKAKKVTKQGIAATSVEVLIKKHVELRNVQIIESLLKKSSLPKVEIEESLNIFRRLAKAEAKVHGMTVDTVHFHEIGAVDTIIDVVGTVCGLRLLGINRVVVSPFPVSHFGPATMELVKGVPVYGVDETHETVTPTGAAILTTLATSFGPYPMMAVERIGYGAGAHDLNRPNLLRLVIGESLEVYETSSGTGMGTETLALLETNIDDVNPQMYDHVSERLFKEGALDVWLTPIHMKKNRPAITLSILCQLAHEKKLADIVFEEGLTLGIRRQLVDRFSLPREMKIVKTTFGDIRVKVAVDNGKIVRTVPEYEDCKKIAESKKIPIQTIMRAAISEWEHSS